MKEPRAPRIDPRRTGEFAAELRARARAWIPSWDLVDSQQDFGRALLDIAARFSSEVAERLDGAGDKMRRGFLDWLAVPREAARPARMPVVFKLTDAAREPVQAEAPVRLQADAGGVPVVFETDKAVRIVRGRLDVVVGVDADGDAFYLPPPGLSDVKPIEPVPTEWQVKSFAAAGGTTLQLEPEEGLAPDVILDAGGLQYRVVSVDKGIAALDPPLEAPVEAASTVRKVGRFEPFGGKARNRQLHALYLGHSDLLNIEAPARIIVNGAGQLRAGVTWQYWGKAERDGEPASEEPDWQELELDSAAPGDVVALIKPAGSVDPKEIGGKSSRWLRAVATTSPAAIAMSAIALRINCSDKPAACPMDPTSSAKGPEAEAMANTTPLVLDSVFYPLGKEPRQFDAFYLGSEEAFSKTNAEVQLCFEMADPTFAALSAISTGPLSGKVLAGVGKDRALHLLSFDAATGRLTKFREREAQHPPLPGFDGAAPPETNAVSLDPQPRWRLPVWTDTTADSGFLVATTSGDAVWIWHEHAADSNREQSGWISFGPIPQTTPQPTTAVSGLVYLADAATPTLAVLRNYQLAMREWPGGAAWVPIDTVEAGTTIELESIVPVLLETATELQTSFADGMVGVSRDGLLYSIDAAGTCVQLSTTVVDTSVRPVAVMRSNGDLIVAAVEPSLSDLLLVDPGGESTFAFAQPDAAVRGLDVLLDTAAVPAEVYFLASVSAGGASQLAWWPSTPGPGNSLIVTTAGVPAGFDVSGAPAFISQHVVLPGERAAARVAPFDLSKRRLRQAAIAHGIVVPAALSALTTNDFAVRIDATPAPVVATITGPALVQGGEAFLPLGSSVLVGEPDPLLAYDLSVKMNGSVKDDELTLDANDLDNYISPMSWIYLDADQKFYNVQSISGSNPRIAMLDQDTGITTSTPSTYVKPIATGGRVAPFMDLDSSNGDFDASLLTQVPLKFPSETPDSQRAKAFSVGLGNQPDIVVLGDEFQLPVQAPAEFVLDAALGEWLAQLGDTSSNPELSWEYWNGKGWWKLDVIEEQTRHLKSSGAVRFVNPPDLVSSDWAGKTNYWIRARLVGGDYGREKITVTTKDLGDDKSEQTVERSTEGIRPPAVVNLTISYRVCDAVEPNFVFTEDSGSLRDQSEANRTAGAIVEAMVPLGVMLGRLENGANAVHASEDDCPPECGCTGRATGGGAAATGASAAGASTVLAGAATGRSILLGIDADVSGAPVNVLLLVDERPHTALAPMAIGALVADQFQPLVVDDATRALGETGVLSMAFTLQPTRRALFGRPGLTWLQLKPKTGADASSWSPVVRGAYLNAVWASATETLTRELLGSSDGAPRLTFRLARPPLLRNSLELRVREPLSDEERAELIRDDDGVVLTDPEGPNGMKGHWVRWRQVTDPDDEAPGDRVYALDEATGEVRFGDGLHGAIPPIGVDSIVAFSYQRTETPAAANLISARTQLNLVSPVESVEAVHSADHAAGGAAPEPDERVLRYGFARLRHRDRAVTARDIEDIALASSPDIAQARVLMRPGRVHLVVVMRGKTPAPSAAQVRELRRRLLDSAPALLAAPGMLRIEGPVERRMAITLQLRIETLDRAAAVSRRVTEQIVRMFNSALGGRDGDGWALGSSPDENDVALALLDTPGLDGIATLALEEHAEGTVRPWPSALAPNELAILADDPLRIAFETAEVTA